MPWRGPAGGSRPRRALPTNMLAPPAIKLRPLGALTAVSPSNKALDREPRKAPADGRGLAAHLKPHTARLPGRARRTNPTRRFPSAAGVRASADGVPGRAMTAGVRVHDRLHKFSSSRTSLMPVGVSFQKLTCRCASARRVSADRAGSGAGRFEPWSTAIQR
jgi:hypothetical protein